ncbi:arsenite methyltransferase [Paenibacillus timonensis]|uniref:Arsenite methyltransferase n=1 Tax=Paenibacillus timonensis TaxID=225915 RepID=A0ABW3SAZ8_9BACL|nr:arsenite methyltransferase [Paenibacillus timonensis]MCH1640050.1 arsenite methyltransferase [Paenibacillus timonensis]GJM83382.1 arsenite S-adenosylmethyltransferase [Paenibacillus sp. HMSSN-139]
MNELTHDEIRQNVRQRYRQIAVQSASEPNAAESSCCSPNAVACCSTPTDFKEISAGLGYSGEELNAVPDGANLGLGCGNPQAIAQLAPGEVVVDLGSGGGFDCFLASRQVGESGKVIGVDMTPEMVSRARQNALKGGFANVDFRLGEIEHLPVADQSVDVIISNCVVNLSPDKEQVFREAYRVLLPGGRLAISDVVTTAELPPEIKNDLEDLYAGCISGASSIPELEKMLAQSGFTNISILPKDESKTFIKEWIPGIKLEEYLVSAVIQAVKA